MAITSAYYSAQGWDTAQWICQVMLDRMALVFFGRANTLEDMKHKEHCKNGSIKIVLYLV